MASPISSIVVKNISNSQTRIVGTPINLKPGQSVDLLTYLAIEDVIGLYGFMDLIDGNIIKVIVGDDDTRTEVPDGASLRALILAALAEITVIVTPPPNQPIPNVIFVDGTNGNDGSGNGSFDKPVKTIAKACALVGNATDAGDFNDPASSMWMIVLAAGAYNENVTVPVRQVVQFSMEGVQINGKVTMNVDSSKYYGGIINEMRVVFKGLALEDSGPLTPPSAVNGNIEVNSSGQMLCSVHAMSCDLLGNVDFNAQGAPFQGVVSLSEANLQGQVNAFGGSAVNLYAANDGGLPPTVVGGVRGNVALLQLYNMSFNGSVITNSQMGGRWRLVQFGNFPNDFSQAGGTVMADGQSAASFNANVTAQGNVVIQMLENAELIFYTPGYPNDWSQVQGIPATTRDALDQLAGRLAALGG